MSIIEHSQLVRLVAFRVPVRLFHNYLNRAGKPLNFVRLGVQERGEGLESEGKVGGCVVHGMQHGRVRRLIDTLVESQRNESVRKTALRQNPLVPENVPFRR